MLRLFFRYSTLFWLLTLCAAGAHSQPNSPRIAVVIGKDAPPLDRFAASQLCAYLDKLFGVKAQPLATPIPHVDVVFLIGSPATNPRISSFPKVSDQGVVLKTLKGSPPALIVGGGSPRATMWAVYELAYRWGVRYLLDRDALPLRSHFKMPELNVVMEPIFKV